MGATYRTSIKQKKVLQEKVLHVNLLLRFTKGWIGLQSFENSEYEGVAS
jgi:hypothetical protein